MTYSELREALAQLAHDDQWTGWMQWFFRKCETQSDGSVLVPAGYVTALKRQMNTPYDQLTEAEKDSDRQEAEKVFALLKQAGIDLEP